MNVSRLRTVLVCCLLFSLLFGAGCANKYLTLDLGKGVTMKLVRIEAGKFIMGSPKTETDRYDEEGHQSEVTISKPFYMGVCEINQAQWHAIMGTEPWKGKLFGKSGADNAATYISWDDAIKFCEILSKKAGKKLTIPTEAQWEYACRAGSKTAYCFGNDASKLGDYAWCHANAHEIDDQYPHAVGRKKPNAWGLYDMHGNVWEWCRDWYSDEFYTKAKKADPENTTEAISRVVRGGAWNGAPGMSRSARRGGFRPDISNHDTGFRVIIPAVLVSLPKTSSASE